MSLMYQLLNVISTQYLELFNGSRHPKLDNTNKLILVWGVLNDADAGLQYSFEHCA